MNKCLLIGCFLISSLVSAQRFNVDTVVPWTVGIGVNIVDNDGLGFEKPFNTESWNFKNPLSVNVERKLHNFISANLAITLNELSRKNKQNNGYLTESSTLFAVDLTGRFFYDQFIFDQNIRVDPFEAYVVLGFGYTSVLDIQTATFDFGLGFNFWIIQDIGLRIQTLGKFGFNNEPYLKNYIQHTAEFIVRF